jgi:Fibronectin type III domain
MPNIVVPAITASVRTAPDAPTVASVADVGTSRAYDDGAVNVTITNPTWDGKLPITTWRATPSVGSAATDIDNIVQVTGLDTTGGPSRTFTAAVGNAVGFSANSANSNAVSVTSVPDTPNTPTASVVSTTRVNLSFTAPNNGGKTITSYTVQSNPSITLTYSGTSSPMAVTGSFVLGTSYTFRLRATNANGSGNYSAYSSAVTPNDYDCLNITTQAECLACGGTWTGSACTDLPV